MSRGLSSWRWNYNEMGDLLRGPEVRAELVSRIERAKVAAEAMSPQGDDDDFLTEPVPVPHAGLYRESFQTDDGVMRDFNGGEVGFARLTNAAPYAVAVEYGNKAGNAHHVMSRALDFMGD